MYADQINFGRRMNSESICKPSWLQMACTFNELSQFRDVVILQAHPPCFPARSRCWQYCFAAVTCGCKVPKKSHETLFISPHTNETRGLRFTVKEASELARSYCSTCSARIFSAGPISRSNASLDSVRTCIEPYHMISTGFMVCTG